MRRVEPVLVTERLVLRQFSGADAGQLLALDGDPAVMRFLDRQTRTLAEIESEVLPRFLASYRRYRDFGFWAADTRHDGEFIGWLGLRPVMPADMAIVHWRDAPPDAMVVELGYRLRRSAWGRGYATEGARALIGRAFSSPGVEEIVATTMAVNARSRRVLDKAGLRYDRTVHVDWPDPLEGTEHGEVEYRLHRTDWAKAEQRPGYLQSEESTPCGLATRHSERSRLSALECRCAEYPRAGVTDEGGGEAEVESGNAVEARDCLVGQVEIGGTEVVEQLAGTACADDGVNGR